MADTSTTVRVDLSGLVNVERKAPKRFDRTVNKIALRCQAEIVQNFAPYSPSSPGQPPGVDTGTLKNSIRTGKVKARVYKTIARTDYAAHLEYGTTNKDGSTRMAARPFMRPAVERTKKAIPSIVAELKLT